MAGGLNGIANEGPVKCKCPGDAWFDTRCRYPADEEDGLCRRCRNGDPDYCPGYDQIMEERRRDGST